MPAHSFSPPKLEVARSGARGRAASRRDDGLGCRGRAGCGSDDPARATGPQPGHLGRRARRLRDARRRHVLHEQHDDAHEPGRAGHEEQGPGQLGDGQLLLRHPRHRGRRRRRLGRPQPRERPELLQPGHLGQQHPAPRRPDRRLHLRPQHRQELCLHDRRPRQRRLGASRVLAGDARRVALLRRRRPRLPHLGRDQPADPRGQARLQRVRGGLRAADPDRERRRAHRPAAESWG